MHIQGAAMKRNRTREPNGRPQRERPLQSAEIRRLRDSAIAHMRHAEWGTVCGMLFLNEKIDAVQYEASKRWGQMHSAYGPAICSPFPVKTLQFDKGHGHPPDPDSDEGKSQAQRDRDAVEGFREAHSKLICAGKLAEYVVRNAVERNEYPVGTEGVEALNRGLIALALHWGLTNQGKRDVR
jgi:hypothetical protein